MKVGVTVGVACVLGFALPMALAWVTGSREIRDGVQPFLAVGVGFAVIFLSVMSLYVSSLCASSLQALVLSVAAGFGLMTFTNRWFLMGWVRLGADTGFNPFASLGWHLGWRPDGRLSLLLMVMSALAVSMYLGELGLLLRFAGANHRSAERGSWRTLRQLLPLGMFPAMLLIVWFGVSNTWRVEAAAYQRAYMQRTFGFVTLAAVATDNRPLTSYTVVVFPENRSRYRGGLLFMVDPARWPHGQVETPLVPGRYSVVAVEQLAWESELTARRDPEMIARLKAGAIPFTIEAGESKTLYLTLSTY
jgi:hypothetical protein